MFLQQIDIEYEDDSKKEESELMCKGYIQLFSPTRAMSEIGLNICRE